MHHGIEQKVIRRVMVLHFFELCVCVTFLPLLLLTRSPWSLGLGDGVWFGFIRVAFADVDAPFSELCLAQHRAVAVGGGIDGRGQ